MALAAKNKLGFINGGVTEPTKESVRNKWRRVDEMVSCWIINLMSKEIIKTFMYYTFAKKLWIELEEKFRESNGSQVY